MYCRNCGRRIDDGMEFCEECQAIKVSTSSTQENYVKNSEVITQNEVESTVNAGPIVEENAGHTENNYNNETTSNNTSSSENTSYTNVNQNVKQDEQKSKLVAGLLGIFLGAFGVHNFYLGFTGKAIAQLLMSLLSCGTLAVVSEIWGLVEGILILTGSNSTDARGVPLKD